ncbi:MAG: tetratricopeptide repeat protein [Acidobacteriota bacterium]|nr:tetratricopeptide repeat protein [Blastocatellia bacterium]MDW8412444.1 tetratricopeptide repeat protein [Acidobacteriota bacterium]
MTVDRLKYFVFIFFVLNSAYLAATATPSMFYMSNLLLHLLIGAALLAVLLFVVRKKIKDLRLDDSWWIVTLVAGICGVALLYLGNSAKTKWILYLHIVLSVVGLLLFALRKQEGRRYLLFMLFAAGLAAISFRIYEEKYYVPKRIVNPEQVPLSMQEEGDGVGSPFFPSSATTNTRGIIPANFFLTSARCGECHKDIYEQWNSSAHHFSSFNNQWYRKSIEYMQEVVGTQPSKWCAGCHDHAVFFNGRFDRPIKEQINTPEAQAGLACTSCHSIVHVRSTMGQGDFEIEYPPLHDLAVSDNPILRFTHDLLLRADPEPHKRAFMRPFYRLDSAQFCSACHKVHLDKPVNSYRWLRGFNEYDNWQASGVSGEGGRSFYSPPEPRKCIDCHMPLVPSNDPAAKNGMVRSHRFPGANTALPYVNGDAEQLKVVTDFLQSKQVTIDIFALSTGKSEHKALSSQEGSLRMSTSFAVGEESLETPAAVVISEPQQVTAPLDKVDAVVRRGDSVRIDVVVRTRNVGHFFPGGTVDAFDVWVELQAVDSKGRIIFWSGMVEDGGRGPVEPGAHFYRSLMLDEHGNRINKRNAWAARSVAYVRLVPPGAADTVRYRLNVPNDCGDEIILKAKLNYRKFSWWNTQWAYAGIRDPQQKNYSVAPGHDDGNWVFTGDTSQVSGKLKSIPDLPIVTMASSEVKLRVINANSPLPAPKVYLDESVRERWNDYGIGLLLQGDIRAAEEAFLKVTQMDPEYADGWVNVARARLQEGRLEAAREMLLKALQLEPELAKAHFFLGQVLKADGQYDEALKHLRLALAKFPRDRVMINETGRVLFLKRQYREAVEMFKRTLAIDPEDLQAHYNLMLCYRGLGETALAEREEKLYRRFKADESAQSITGEFRRLNPEDNNERQSIHEHKSVPAEKIANWSKEERYNIAQR